MKLEGIGRVEEVQTDDEGQLRSLNISAVVGGTPIVITLDAGPGICFVEAMEQDKNISVEVAR